MLKKIKSLVLSAALMVGFVAPIALPVTASAAPVDDACKGLTATGGGSCSKDAGNLVFTKQIQTIINILSILVGAVSVIMIIIGGFRYVISNGDSNGLSGAKNTILYAIVGLVIVIFAQSIVRFVLTNVN